MIRRLQLLLAFGVLAAGTGPDVGAADNPWAPREWQYRQPPESRQMPERGGTPIYPGGPGPVQTPEYPPDDLEQRLNETVDQVHRPTVTLPAQPPPVESSPYAWPHTGSPYGYSGGYGYPGYGGYGYPGYGGYGGVFDDPALGFWPGGGGWGGWPFGGGYSPFW